MPRSGWGWVRVKTPVKLDKWKKEQLLQIVKDEIEKTTKLKKIVSRIDIKAGRVYLYNLFEPAQLEGAVFTIPLIDGKYLEFPLARITLYNEKFTDCSLDWKRHNDQWMTIETGSLPECIQKAEVSDWFEV